MNVYVIASEGGMCKVGKANNPHDRMSALRTGHPHKLSLAKVFNLGEQANAYDVERLAHEALQPHRMEGEWFKVSPEDAIDAIERIVRPEPEPQIWVDMPEWRSSRIIGLADELADMQKLLLGILKQCRMSEADVNNFKTCVDDVAGRLGGLMYEEDDL